VLGAFFLVLLVGMGIFFRLSWGDGELGSFKHDQLGAYEDFSAAAPLVMRVVTATVDPPVDPERPWERFKSISMGAEIVASPDGSTPSTVTMNPSADPVPDGVASELARSTGCEGQA
jgi:hypothetical protein